MPRKGQSKKAISKAYFPIGQHTKNKKDLKEVYSKFQETQRRLNCVKKVIVNLYPLIMNFDYTYHVNYIIRKILNFDHWSLNH